MTPRGDCQGAQLLLSISQRTMARRCLSRSLVRRGTAAVPISLARIACSSGGGAAAAVSSRDAQVTTAACAMRCDALHDMEMHSRWKWRVRRFGSALELPSQPHDVHLFTLSLCFDVQPRREHTQRHDDDDDDDQPQRIVLDCASPTNSLSLFLSSLLCLSC